MWFQLFILVLSVVISSLLAPKPEVPKAATFGDLKIPTATENRPIPVVFGTVWITGPNVVWYGDLSTEDVYSEGGKK